MRLRVAALHELARDRAQRVRLHDVIPGELQPSTARARAVLCSSAWPSAVMVFVERIVPRTVAIDPSSQRAPTPAVSAAAVIIDALTVTVTVTVTERVSSSARRCGCGSSSRFWRFSGMRECRRLTGAPVRSNKGAERIRSGSHTPG